MRAVLAQFFSSEIHGGCAHTCHAGGHSQPTYAHYQLQKAHTFRPDTGRNMHLEAGGDKTQKQIHSGQKQSAVKDRQFSDQKKSPPLSSIYGDKGGNMLIRLYTTWRGDILRIWDCERCRPLCRRERSGGRSQNFLPEAGWHEAGALPFPALFLETIPICHRCGCSEYHKPRCRVFCKDRPAEGWRSFCQHREAPTVLPLCRGLCRCASSEASDKPVRCLWPYVYRIRRNVPNPRYVRWERLPWLPG